MPIEDELSGAARLHLRAQCLGIARDMEPRQSVEQTLDNAQAIYDWLVDYQGDDDAQVTSVRRLPGGSTVH